MFAKTAIALFAASAVTVVANAQSTQQEPPMVRPTITAATPAAPVITPSTAVPPQTPVVTPTTPATPTPAQLSSSGESLADRASKPAAARAAQADAAARALADMRKPAVASPFGLSGFEPTVLEIFGRTGALSAVVAIEGREYLISDKAKSLPGGWQMLSISADTVVIAKGKQTQRLQYSRVDGRNSNTPVMFPAPLR